MPQALVKRCSAASIYSSCQSACGIRSQGLHCKEPILHTLFPMSVNKSDRMYWIYSELADGAGCHAAAVGLRQLLQPSEAAQGRPVAWALSQGSAGEAFLPRPKECIVHRKRHAVLCQVLLHFCLFFDTFGTWWKRHFGRGPDVIIKDADMQVIMPTWPRRQQRWSQPARCWRTAT